MKKAIKTILLIAWMALIFYFSSRDGDASKLESRKVMSFIFGEHINNEFIHFIVRKCAHVFLYFVLGILAYLLTSEYEKRSLIIAGLICVLYAISDEIHQYFVPSRSMQFTDVLLDSISSFIGMLCVRLSLKYVNERNASKRKGN